MGGDQLVTAVAGERAEAEHGDELRTAHDVLYLASIQTTSVFEGSRELLVDLKDRGWRIVLASSAKEQEVDHYLDLLDARELADDWTTSADVESTKPEPDLVLAALEKLGTSDNVMVGDTPWDVEAAAKAGVPTIAVIPAASRARSSRTPARLPCSRRSPNCASISRTLLWAGRTTTRCPPPPHERRGEQVAAAGRIGPRVW